MKGIDYLTYALQQSTKNKVVRDATLPTAQEFQATWNGPEAADSNLSNITLQGGGTARYVPKSTSVTGLTAGDIVIVRSGGSTPFYIAGKLVGDIRLAQYSGDTVPPTGVGSLVQGTTTMTSIVISWTTATDNIGVGGYNVSVNGTFVGTISGTTYTFSGGTASTTYTFKVQAVDYAGNLGPASSANFTTSADTSHGTFTKSYSGIWSATYYSEGLARVTSLSNTLAQGKDSTGKHRLGILRFDANALATDLAGATINNIQFKMTVSAIGSPGLIIMSTGNIPNTSPPGNLGTSGFNSFSEYSAFGWSAGQTKTISYYSTTYVQTLQSGSWNCMIMGDNTSTSGYSATAYGYQGGVYAPQLIVTYTK